jgi:hypothetical protein
MASEPCCMSWCIPQDDERETFPVDQSQKRLAIREGAKGVRKRRNVVLNSHTDWSLMTPPASRQLLGCQSVGSSAIQNLLHCATVDRLVLLDGFLNEGVPSRQFGSDLERLLQALVSSQGRSRPLVALILLKCAEVISPNVCADPQGQGRAHLLSNNGRPWWGFCKLQWVEKAAIQQVDLGTTGHRRMRRSLFLSSFSSRALVRGS